MYVLLFPELSMLSCFCPFLCFLYPYTAWGAHPIITTILFIVAYGQSVKICKIAPKDDILVLVTGLLASLTTLFMKEMADTIRIRA